MRNRKAQAGYGMTWLYRFALLAVIVFGMVFVVLSHYSKSVDVRDMEASVLSRRIAECVAPGGIVEEFSEAAIEKCFPVDEHNLNFNISLKNSHVDTEESFLLKLCEAMEQGIKVEKYPACLRSSYIVLDNGKAENLKIFIAISKTDTNL